MQAAREAARRAQLRQQHEADRRRPAQLPSASTIRFPPGWFQARLAHRCLDVVPMTWSATSRLLQFMEQSGAVQRREFHLRLHQRRRPHDWARREFDRRRSPGSPRSFARRRPPPASAWRTTRIPSTAAPATATSPRWARRLEFADAQTGGPPNGPFRFDATARSPSAADHIHGRRSATRSPSANGRSATGIP